MIAYDTIMNMGGNLIMKTTKKGWGGFRPGAGRKPSLKKPRRISMLLDDEQFEFCKQNNKIISHYIRSLIDNQMQQKNKVSKIAT